MEKEMKITAPEGCEIEKVKIVDGVAIVTFRKKEQKIPKSWEEFCEMFPIKEGECFIDSSSDLIKYKIADVRSVETDRNMLPDRATAEAILALCQLIQLRNCYNGDWMPDWKDFDQKKYSISFEQNIIEKVTCYLINDILHFKTEELRDEFLRNFRDLIEKLKPLYGIKEGGKKL